MMVSVSNLVSAIKRLQENGMWVVGLDQRADRYLWDEPSIRGKLTLVVGSEEAGISPIVARACDDIRSIPMFGKTGSLNAAVAASIGMYEWMRSVVKGEEGRDG
jgi:23S rRNA (guanosine2251-2'-O)-methyltransferase